MSPEQIYQELHARLRRLRQSLRLHEWLVNASLAVIALTAAVILLSALAKLMSGATAARWLFFILFFVLLAGTMVLLFISPVRWMMRRAPVDLSDLALLVGRGVQKVRDRLADALQVYREQQAKQDGEISRSLAEHALIVAAAELSDEDFTSVVDRAKTRRRGMAAVATLVAAILLWLIAPKFLSDGFAALLNPSRNVGETELAIDVSPGDAEVIKGETLAIDIHSTGLDRPSARVERRVADSDYLEAQSASRRSTGLYQHKFENVREDFSYRVQLGGAQSRWFGVRVVELPQVRRLNVSLQFPKYTGLPPRELEENVGDVQALAGTIASLRVQSNKELSSAQLAFDDGSFIPLTSRGQDFAGSFTVRRDGSYQVALQDETKLANKDAITYRVQVLADASPTVRITFPGQDADLGEDMRAPLTIQADDDYGFSRLQIVYEIMRSGQTDGKANTWRIPISSTGNHLQQTAEWDLTSLGLLPDDVVAYYAEVFDNDAVSGPKSARSETYHLRFPSIEEIFDELADNQDEAVDELQQSYEQTRQLKEAVDKVVQEMKKDPDLDWEQKQKLNEAAGASEKTQQQMEDLQKRLDEMLSTMERNDLLSAETMKKYEELQKLMQELTSPEMKKALEEIQKAMKELSPEQLQEALKNFQFSQEQLLQNLERTINLLKQVQAEQKLDEAIKKLQELQKRQEEINKKTAESSQDKPNDNLSRQEEAIKADAESLQKSLQDLSKQMAQVPQAPSQKIDQASQMMDSGDMTGEMQRMSNQLQQGEMQSAQQSGQRISQLMQQMQTALQSAQQDMQSSQKRAVMQAMQRASNDLLQLSKSQEQLMKQSGSQNNSASRFNELADQQQNLMSGLQRVAEQLGDLSQKTLAVTPEVARALGQAMAKMQESLKAIEQRNGRDAGRGQGEAMQGLDRAVSEMREAMRNMSGSSSGSGFDQFMQRLLGLSGQQQSINQETQQMGEQGMNSMQQRAAMARLAAQQLAVQKSLEQLAAEAGQRSDILGRLDQAAKEMEDVVKDLQNRNVGRQTIERQQHILSRMLDAQRSMRERDFSKQREAETGKTYRALSPGALPEDFGERASRMQQDLLRALQENYSRDYKELIQKYFDALSQQERQRAQGASQRP